MDFIDPTHCAQATLMLISWDRCSERVGTVGPFELEAEQLEPPLLDSFLPATDLLLSFFNLLFKCLHVAFLSCWDYCNPIHY